MATPEPGLGDLGQEPAEEVGKELLGGEGGQELLSVLLASPKWFEVPDPEKTTHAQEPQDKPAPEIGTSGHAQEPPELMQPLRIYSMHRSPRAFLEMMRLLQDMEAAERIGDAWLVRLDPQEKPAVLKAFEEGMILVDGWFTRLKDLCRRHVVVSGDPALFLEALKSQPHRSREGLRASELKVTILDS